MSGVRAKGSHSWPQRPPERRFSRRFLEERGTARHSLAYGEGRIWKRVNPSLSPRIFCPEAAPSVMKTLKHLFTQDPARPLKGSTEEEVLVTALLKVTAGISDSEKGAVTFTRQEWTLLDLPLQDPRGGDVMAKRRPLFASELPWEHPWDLQVRSHESALCSERSFV